MSTGFVALPVQERLFNVARTGDHRIIGFGGGIRGTKTWGGLALVVTLCRIFPRSRWAVVRKDFPRLRQNTIPSFNKLKEQFGGFVGDINQQSWTATCRNGSEIIFFAESLDIDPDLSRWKGLEVNGFLLEEADELAERSYYKAIERAGAWIIPSGIQPPPYVICTFNPCANWPKRVFYEPWKQGVIKAPYAFIPATAADNPYIADAQREAWKAMPEQEYRRFVEGDWDVLTGRYYGELNASVHIKPRDVLPETIPLWWEAWGSYDWGYAHWATFGLWVKDANGTPYLIDSMKVRRQQDEEQAKNIVRFANDHGMGHALHQVFAGRDAFNRVTARGASGKSTADVFLEQGIRLERADDDKINGGRAVRRALHIQTFEDDTPPVAGVYLIDTPTNRWVFDQLAEIMPDENDVNKPAKVDCDAEGRGGDDGADMFRNGLSTQQPDVIEPLPVYNVTNVANGQAEPAPWEILAEKWRMPTEDGQIDRRVYTNRRGLDHSDNQFGEGW